jgi:hypothetical protein
MIEIINREPHLSVTKDIICRHCGVTLRYTPNDVKERMVSDYTGCKDLYRFIKCPNCNKDLGVR